MKTKFLLLLLGMLSLSVFSNAADVNVSVGVNTGDFAFLADYGNWVDVQGYGRCWRPSVAVTWRPFYYGDWTMTNQGWTWASYEPYGWAVYHYGNWHRAPGFGWVWIPGYEWSAARVSWTSFGGNIAWAPLPPRGVVLPDPWAASKVAYWNVVAINRFTNENVGRFVIRTGLRRPAATVRIVRTAPAVVDVERVIGRKIEVVHINRAVVTGPHKLERIEFPVAVTNRINVHRKIVERDVIVHRKTVVKHETAQGKKEDVHKKKTTTVKKEKQKDKEKDKDKNKKP